MPADSNPPASSRYVRLLTDSRWQYRRLRVLNPDHFRCPACGDGDQPLHVHPTGHIRGRAPWEYPSHMLVTLCAPCHHRLHHKPKRADAEPAEQFPLI